MHHKTTSVNHICMQIRKINKDASILFFKPSNISFFVWHSWYPEDALDSDQSESSWEYSFKRTKLSKYLFFQFTISEPETFAWELNSLLLESTEVGVIQCFHSCSLLSFKPTNSVFVVQYLLTGSISMYDEKVNYGEKPMKKQVTSFAVS